MQLDLVLVVGEPGPNPLRAVGRVPVDGQVDLVGEVPTSRSRNWHMTFASNDSVKTMKCISPLVLIADIAFTENRLPVRCTTGVVPVARPTCGR